MKKEAVAYTNILLPTRYSGTSRRKKEEEKSRRKPIDTHRMSDITLFLSLCQARVLGYATVKRERNLERNPSSLFMPREHLSL